MENGIDELQSKLQQLRSLYDKAIESHEASAGTVRRELERVIDKLTAEIQEVEWKIAQRQAPD